MKVFKYEVKAGTQNGQGSARIDMPRNAKILSTAFIDDDLFVWALVNPSATAEPRYIRVSPTGHPIPNEVVPKLAFIGTALMPLNPVVSTAVAGLPARPAHTLVFHVFEDLSE